MSASAGVTVSATSSDARIASPYANASGRKNDPVSPPRNRIGTVDTMMIIVAWMMGPRTSRDASSTIRAVDLVLPSRRCWRSRRTMFSMSMIASSTITPSAITKPARIIVLIVAPTVASTSPAATRDSGIVTRLISATRHSKRKNSRISVTRMKPRIIARPRLSIEVSMKVAGRKMVVSTRMPGSPGCIAVSASSTPRVTSTVLPQGSFSTISMMPTPSSMMASPLRCGWCSRTTVGDVADPGLPAAPRRRPASRPARSR